MSGYFFSPSFPGYYLDDVFCTWRISVPNGNIIRLTFHEFRLRDQPLCENCFLEFFDGRDQTAPARGRFCGQSYPPVFVSSSNHLMAVLRCHGKPPIARFKAFYQSVTGMYLVCSESITTSHALVGIYLPPVLSVTTESMCTLSKQSTELEPKRKQKFHIQTYNINLQTVTEMGR